MRKGFHTIQEKARDSMKVVGAAMRLHVSPARRLQRSVRHIHGVIHVGLGSRRKRRVGFASRGVDGYQRLAAALDPLAANVKRPFGQNVRIDLKHELAAPSVKR